MYSCAESISLWGNVIMKNCFSFFSSSNSQVQETDAEFICREWKKKIRVKDN
jgi:hypothetical protein